MSVDALVAVAKQMVAEVGKARLDVKADLDGLKVLAVHLASLVDLVERGECVVTEIAPMMVFGGDRTHPVSIFIPDFAWKRLGRPMMGAHLHVGVDALGVRVFSDADVGDIAGGRLAFGENELAVPVVEDPYDPWTEIVLRNAQAQAAGDQWNKGPQPASVHYILKSLGNPISWEPQHHARVVAILKKAGWTEAQYPGRKAWNPPVEPKP